jgi:hypothetical protein
MPGPKGRDLLRDPGSQGGNARRHCRHLPTLPIGAASGTQVPGHPVSNSAIHLNLRSTSRANEFRFKMPQWASGRMWALPKQQRIGSTPKASVIRCCDSVSKILQIDGERSDPTRLPVGFVFAVHSHYSRLTRSEWKAIETFWGIDGCVRWMRTNGKPDVLLHHSDQGSQHNSKKFQ